MRHVLRAIVVAGSALPVAVVAFGDGPKPGATGGFGEPSCATCHVDAPSSTNAGPLRVDGLPSSFAPGAQYVVALTLTGTDLTRGGFSMAARYADGTLRGRQAGTLDEMDAKVQILSDGSPPVQYAVHTAVGSRAAEVGSLVWRVLWTAPMNPSGRIAFNVAANAANDDQTPLGDTIYLCELLLTAP